MIAETSATDLQSIGVYDLIAKIAEGGMGTVYKGRSRITGELVAIKVVPPHLLSNHVFLKRFEHEYTAARALDHPNVVKAIEFGRAGKSPFLVMEYVEGESLGQRLDRVHHLSDGEAIHIISQVAQGLHKAHKLGLIHRDVKPDNILITPDGQVKLTDLGLVKELEADLNLTRTGRGLGTPHFMAPEQFRNAKKADVRCDVYSLAATMYQMVTGELPFKSLSPLDAWMKKLHNELAPPGQVLPGLNERIDWAIRRSMSADPNQRAGSCEEFVEDLTGQSTRRLPSANVGIATDDLWYMVYKDDEGVVHTVKGSTEGIRRSLSQGLLGDAMNVRVARSKQGPFELLHHRAEFRDLSIGLSEWRRLTPTSLSAKTTKPMPLPDTTPLPADRPTDTSLSDESGNSPLAIPALPPAPSAPAWSPHINLERTAETPEAIKWLVMILLATGAGIGGYLLMPYLSYLRLW